MEKTVYLLARRLELIDGGCHYDPCVIPTINVEETQMIAHENLVTLQEEFVEHINLFRGIADVIIVPVSEDVYNELANDLKNMITEFNEKITEAVTQMCNAYKLMGVEVDAEATKMQLMQGMQGFSDAGKVIDSNMTLVERGNYVLDEYEDENEDDYEEDDFDDSEDDDYTELDDDDYSDEENHYSYDNNVNE